MAHTLVRLASNSFEQLCSACAVYRTTPREPTLNALVVGAAKWKRDRESQDFISRPLIPNSQHDYASTALPLLSFQRTLRVCSSRYTLPSATN